jgi:hypothetical protein
VTRNGARVPSGRGGGAILNPSLSKLRQQRAALAQLLGRLDIPGASSTNAVRARKAARARWQEAS